jgi:RNA polymerase sigma factor (sigma-70 family)
MAGDAVAFAGLVGRYERTALAVAYSTLGDANASGDVVQEAFLKAWQRLADLKEPERFGAWLSRMVRNLAIDSRRRKPLALAGETLDELDGSHPSDVATESDDPSSAFVRRETRQQINEALAGLDELTRSAVVLRYYDNLSSKQIGELLGMSPAAIDMRLSRARAELKQSLAHIHADRCAAG